MSGNSLSDYKYKWNIISIILMREVIYDYHTSNSLKGGLKLDD